MAVIWLPNKSTAAQVGLDAVGLAVVHNCEESAAMQKLVVGHESAVNAVPGNSLEDHVGLDAVGLAVVQTCEESEAMQKLVVGHETAVNVVPGSELEDHVGAGGAPWTPLVWRFPSAS